MDRVPRGLATSETPKLAVGINNVLASHKDGHCFNYTWQLSSILTALIKIACHISDFTLNALITIYRIYVFQSTFYRKTSTFLMHYIHESCRIFLFVYLMAFLRNTLITVKSFDTTLVLK